MRPPGRRQALGLSLGLVVALALTMPAWADEARKGIVIEIGQYENDTVGAVWLAYAAGLATQLKDAELQAAPLGLYVPSFAGELAARATMIKVWHELRDKDATPFAYMEALSRIDAAGFLREYVWTVHWHGSWKQQPTDLRIAEFYAWQRKELAGHEPQTRSRVRVILGEPKAADAPVTAASN